LATFWSNKAIYWDSSSFSGCKAVPAFAGVLLGEKSNFLRKIDNWLKQNPAYASPVKAQTYAESYSLYVVWHRSPYRHTLYVLRDVRRCRKTIRVSTPYNDKRNTVCVCLHVVRVIFYYGWSFTLGTSKTQESSC